MCVAADADAAPSLGTTACSMCVLWFSKKKAFFQRIKTYTTKHARRRRNWVGRNTDRRLR